MIGRRVKSVWGETGTVIKWEPLSYGMCDTLIRQDNGKEIWFSSTDLRPIDNLGLLPSRSTKREVERHRAIASLKSIKEKFINEDWNKPWPGCEFAKAIIGNTINNAIKELERK